MARNDGIDRTFARNQDLPTLDDVAKVAQEQQRLEVVTAQSKSRRKSSALPP